MRNRCEISKKKLAAVSHRFRSGFEILQLFRESNPRSCFESGLRSCFESNLRSSFESNPRSCFESESNPRSCFEFGSCRGPVGEDSGERIQARVMESWTRFRAAVSNPRSCFADSCDGRGAPGVRVRISESGYPSQDIRVRISELGYPSLKAPVDIRVQIAPELRPCFHPKVHPSYIPFLRKRRYLDPGGMRVSRNSRYPDPGHMRVTRKRRHLEPDCSTRIAPSYRPGPPTTSGSRLCRYPRRNQSVEI